MQDQENWEGPDDSMMNGGNPDPNMQRMPDQDMWNEDIMTPAEPLNQSGRKGGEAGGSGSGDTSDYGTDSSVDTQDVIGVGSANEDFDEAGGDATDNIAVGPDEDEDVE